MRPILFGISRWQREFYSPEHVAERSEDEILDSFRSEKLA